MNEKVHDKVLTEKRMKFAVLLRLYEFQLNVLTIF